MKSQNTLAIKCEATDSRNTLSDTGCSDEEMEACFRNTGVVPVPRKVEFSTRNKVIPVPRKVKFSTIR